MSDHHHLISNKRRALLGGIFQQILHTPLSKPLLIAVDGVDRVGKTVFAGELPNMLM
ncbi:MAG: hypothetical protein OSB68_01775 [Dehalococcoidia bacterium]|nr:hypothetical protein [Dehalococcoidia bacterium]